MAPAAEITLPLALYLGAWLVGTIAVAWLTVRVLRATAPDGTPRLFWFMRHMPKQETLLAVGIGLTVVTAVPFIWRTYVLGLAVGPASSEWLWFLTGLLAINGGTYIGKLIAERRTGHAAESSPTGDAG